VKNYRHFFIGNKGVASWWHALDGGASSEWEISALRIQFWSIRF